MCSGGGREEGIQRTRYYQSQKGCIQEGKSRVMGGKSGGRLKTTYEEDESRGKGHERDYCVFEYWRVNTEEEKGSR